jgi:hypothetical protein
MHLQLKKETMNIQIVTLDCAFMSLMMRPRSQLQHDTLYLRHQKKKKQKNNDLLVKFHNFQMKKTLV